jgi:hypothetical protein
MFDGPVPVPVVSLKSGNGEPRKIRQVRSAPSRAGSAARCRSRCSQRPPPSRRGTARNRARHRGSPALGVEHLQVRLGVLGGPRGARRPCWDHHVSQELEADRVGDLAGAHDGPLGMQTAAVEAWSSENTTSAVAALAPGSRYPSMAASALTFLRWVAVTSRDSRLVVEVVGDDVADERVQLEQNVAEAGDREVGPVGQYALYQRDRPTAQSIEILVGHVQAGRQERHSGTARARHRHWCTGTTVRNSTRFPVTGKRVGHPPRRSRSDILAIQRQSRSVEMGLSIPSR